MPSSLTTVIIWIDKSAALNEKNRRLLHRFVDFMKETENSEKYQRVNFIVVILFAKSLGSENLSEVDRKEDILSYLRRHVIPETLEDVNDTLLASIEETIKQDKIKKIFIQSESEQGLQGITSYGGLLGTLADLAGEKYGAAAQKILIPTIAGMIRKFMVDNKIEDESTAIGKEIMPLIEPAESLLAAAKLRQDAALISIFNNLKLVLDNPAQGL